LTGTPDQSMSRRRSKLPEGLFEVSIDRLGSDGLGVGFVGERQVRLAAVLVGERVRFRYTKRSRRFDEGLVAEILEPAPGRVQPRCPHFGICGGCAFQHLDHECQLRMKSDRVSALFDAQGVEMPPMSPPLVGPLWGYRNKARLGAKYLIPKSLALVGFRERGSGLVTAIERCQVLHASVGERIEALRQLLQSLDARTRLPQIEIATGDAQTALVFRHLESLTEADCVKLCAFSSAYDVQIYLQSGGPATVQALAPKEPEPLYYDLPAQDIRLWFDPLNFTQVNPAVNRLMVAQAITWLEPASSDRMLDLFCGLGNFSLAFARHCKSVVGLEADEPLIAKARQNANQNGVNNAEFYAVDLRESEAVKHWLTQPWSMMLLDPPRSGAAEVVEHLVPGEIPRILYVSCGPESLARDAELLVERKGYRLEQIAIADMFPHTNHVETMALFESVET